VKAVLDPNVIISALLSPTGSPAKVLRAWIDGSFELIASELLLGELERALSYPKLRTRIDAAEAAELVELLRREAELFEDPDAAAAIVSPDPGDNYLIALAATARAVIVSGDGHLLGLADKLPVYSPADFLALLARGT
jgi:putative PIN family toxin of toxin-antitoxin system